VKLLLGEVNSYTRLLFLSERASHCLARLVRLPAERMTSSSATVLHLFILYGSDALIVIDTIEKPNAIELD
jgi:hypothetical protein